MPFEVRDAHRADAAGPDLLYRSSAPYYDAFAGSEARARRLVEALWPRRGHTASWDACRVAVTEAGDVAGAMVAFPAEAGDALARRFLALAVLRLPPWLWPHVTRHLRASAEVMPVAPAASLYVDALAVAPDHRRRGAATALLEDAQRSAERSGLRGVSLDTGLKNEHARALYERAGFTATGERKAASDRVAAAVGGPGFVSYFRPGRG